MDLPRNLGNLTRAAARLLADRAAAQRAPIVAWLPLGLSAEDFARQVAYWREQRPDARIFAVLPYGSEAPPGTYAVELPPKAYRLLHPALQARNRVADGGRGSGKSHSFARSLILRAIAGRVRVGCFREIQRSVRESVHRLLSDTIDTLGLSRWFDVGVQTIRSRTGSEFIFEGLWGNTNKIRSLEGLDYAWVEEAAKVSESSWEVLIPTVRGERSELWINFNPEAEDDPTYRRFITSPPPWTLREHFTFEDNPFFPSTLERERQYLLRVDPDAHAHVYGGHCRSQSDAQVFKDKYVVQPFEPEAGWEGPFQGADWGFSVDPTTLVRAWISGRVLYVEHEAYGVGVDIDRTPALFDGVPDARRHTIRADSARPETISYMQGHGFPNIQGATKWPSSVEEGVQFLRQFERIIVHSRCRHVAEEMRLYSFRTDRLTGDVMPELLDRHNHTIDALRYALEPLIRGGGGRALLQFYEAEIEAAKRGEVPDAVRTDIPEHAPKLVAPKFDDSTLEYDYSDPFHPIIRSYVNGAKGPGR